MTTPARDLCDPDYPHHYPGESAEDAFQRRWPHKYASTARLVNLCVAFSQRIRNCECDVDHTCPRHERVTELAERYVRLTRIWRRR